MICFKLYDPLGWLALVVVVAKNLMQELWIRKLDWNEKLPEDLLVHWFKFYRNLGELEVLRIPRWMGRVKSDHVAELHGFCDASNKAYAACVYLRTIDEFGKANTNLVIVKTKVAPILLVTIPRLELCGAVILINLLKLTIIT